MSSMILLGISIVVYLLAYVLSGLWLNKKRTPGSERKTPAYTKRDDWDFVPAKGPVLFGHQFAAIAGLGVIAGPIAGAAFGWLPVLLWFLAGGIFLGAVQNFGVLSIIVREKEAAIGPAIEKTMGRKTRLLFLVFAWAVTVALMAALTRIGALSLTGSQINEAGEEIMSSANGAVAMASMLLIPLSIGFGYFNQKKKGLFFRTLLGLLILALCIAAGFCFPLYQSQGVWMVVILLFLWLSSVMPVWALLQSRNYLGSFLLYIMMAAAVLGIFWMDPKMNIPAVSGWQADGNLAFPFLFLLSGPVVSGFHGLVSSEITARQLKNEKSGKAVGYGTALLAALAGVIVLLTAGSTVQDLAHLKTETPFALFTAGADSFFEEMGVPSDGLNLIHIVIHLGVSTAILTSLDTLARLGRTLLQEIFEPKKKGKPRRIQDKYIAGALTVAAAAVFTFVRVEEAWEIFGICSMILSAFLFWFFACWFRQHKKRYGLILIPGLFLSITALGAVGILLKETVNPLWLGENLSLSQEVFGILLGVIGLTGLLLTGCGLFTLLRKKRKGEDKVKKIIFATGNEDKMKEIREILADTDWQVQSLKEAGIQADIVEDGKTFEENAEIKAKTICRMTGEIVLADDSGLEIDYLNKEPGIYSARYMGEDTSYHIKNARLIERLDQVPDEKRTARFVCAIAAAFPDGSVKTVRGVMEGRIGYEEKGENGFGYDPIFYLPEYGCTSAELSREEKNEISHRGKALRAIKKELV